MNRAIARALHESTNATYWMENPNWSAGNPAADLALAALRKIPFSVHELQKKHLFRDAENVTVSGESVVVADTDVVHKYMFRYPGTMQLGDFYVQASQQVETVTQTLGNIALPTTVSLELADVFRRPFTAVKAVTQTQQKLDLASNPPLSAADLQTTARGQFDTTANDLDILLRRTEKLAANDGYYPDIALSSSNLRRNIFTGNVRLIDVLPISEDGSRLIGDSPSKLPHNLEMIQSIQEFVGQYGR